MKKKMKIKLRNLLLLAAGILLLGAGAVYNYLSSQVKLVPYEVKLGDLQQMVEATGTVASQHSEVIYARQGGFVSALDFEVGSAVKAGDQVALLSSEDLSYSIQTAQAQLSGARAQYAQAAEQNDPLLTQISETAVASAQLNYDTAVKALADAQVLLEAGALSKADLEAATVTASHAQAALKTAQNQLALQKKGVSGNLLRTISASITAAQSELNRLKAMDGNRKVISGVSGIMTERYVSLGAFVAPGMPVAEISSADQLQVASDVVAKDVPRIKAGMKVEIRSEGNVVASGSVTKIHPKLTEKMSNLGIVQKRVRVEIAVESTQSSMMLGQDVEVRFIEAEKTGVLLVASDYVYEDGDLRYILVNENGRLARRDVKTGIKGELHYEILSGVSEGEQIVGEIENTVSLGDRIQWVQE